MDDILTQKLNEIMVCEVGPIGKLILLRSTGFGSDSTISQSCNGLTTRWAKTLLLGVSSEDLVVGTFGVEIIRPGPVRSMCGLNTGIGSGPIYPQSP